MRSPQDTGQNAGRYFPYGNAADLPVDQRAEDGRSVSFDLPLTRDVEILGNARARLRVNSPTERGQVYVRLCDVAPDGSSTLITRGNLNLSAREGRDRMVPMPVGEWVDVEVPMTGIGYHFPAGHVLRVAVSTAYWPWVWPQADAQGLTLDVDRSEMVLPVRPVPADGSEQATLDASVSFDPPVQPVGLDVTYPEAGHAGAQRPERLVSTDVVARTTELQVDPAYGGTRIYPDGLHYDEDTVERYWIDADDPTTARTEAVWKVGISRPDQDWQTSLEATTRLSCDAENFFTESILDCWDHEQQVFHKEWRSTIPREAS